MNYTYRPCHFGFRHDLHRWQHLVTPAWLAGLFAGQEIVAPPGRDWRLFEVGFGGLDEFRLGHIPEAGYIDTTELETGPFWNKVSDQALLQFLLNHGISCDTTVVLCSRNSLAAARAAHLMLYAGVKDVRMLDGGFDGWRRLGLPEAQGIPVGGPAASHFGGAFPAHPEYLCDVFQARSRLRQADAHLISIRTWNEFIGRTSGYPYIDARGDIPGARWGRSGKEGDVNSMSEFQLLDGRMKSSAAILGMWRGAGIAPGRQTTFYCGTGWRASLAFFYAWLMNWERISVFDGGWLEWSQDPANPVICRVDCDSALGSIAGLSDHQLLEA